MTVLEALKSQAFKDVVLFIRNKCWDAAEGVLMEMESDQAQLFEMFTTNQRCAIEGAMEECWKRVERRM